MCEYLARRLPQPSHIVEPTCGSGAFLRAAAAAWPGVPLTGWELVDEKRAALGEGPWTVHGGDAFALDWPAILPTEPGLLMLGNPPWGTADAFARVQGLSPPRRRGQVRGDGRTGAANFDTAEWLLVAWLEALAARRATVAMLVKASTARRVLLTADRLGLPLTPVGMWGIDARRAFRASVDACLFVVTTGGPGGPCPVSSTLDTPPSRRVCIEEGRWIADAEAWRDGRRLLGTAPIAWRSGVKHDCAAVMEIDPDGRNGLGELVDTEATHRAPFLKGADVAAGRPPSRQLILPHRSAGADTGGLHDEAPRTLAYLERHAERLEARRSRIWRSGPRFGLFGLGPYSFAPWKVVAPAIHRPTVFRVVGPQNGLPVLVDDTTVFLPMNSEAQAREAARALESPAVSAYLRARVPPRSKRALTVTILGALDWSKALD